MTADEYHEYIIFLSNRSCTLDYMIEKWKESNAKLYEAVSYVKNEFFLDFSILKPYIGLYKNIKGEEKDIYAFYKIIIDAQYENQKINDSEICRKYNYEKDLIFKETDLIDKKYDDDLIDYSSLEHIDSNIFRINGKYVLSDKRINSEFYKWMDKCFADSNRYIHIDPNFVSDIKPSSSILECLLRKPDKNWWTNLERYKGVPSSNIGSYTLWGEDDIQSKKEFEIYKVRNLQTCAHVDEKGYVSMMIEELSDFENISDNSEHYVIGRLIHFDSDAIIGHDFKSAQLKHIDLAFNFYNEQIANDRLNNHVKDKDKNSVNSRTHILRVNNVPFSTLFKFSYYFFKSQTLVNEWIKNEFE